MDTGKFPTSGHYEPADGKALMLFTLAPQKTLEAAVDTTIATIPDFPCRGAKEQQLTDLPAIITQAKQSVQDQSTGATQTNMVYSYFINYDNRIYVIHGVTAEADFNSFLRLFDSSMASFSRLTDASKINVKPKRIQVKKVPRNESLSDAFAYFGVPQAQYKELALLNDLELTDQVASGKLDKDNRRIKYYLIQTSPSCSPLNPPDASVGTGLKGT